MSNTGEKPYCSFCGKSHDEVRKLILASDNAAICDDCINMCVIILREDGIEVRGELPYPPSRSDFAAPLAETPGERPSSPQTEFAAILEAIRRHALKHHFCKP